MPVTVLLSLAGASVSAGVAGAGFGPVVGNYLCDTQACALGCPGEQSLWSDRNNHLLCVRVCGRAAEKAELGWGQLRPWWLRMPCSRLSPCTGDTALHPLSTAHPLPCPGHFGLASRALAGATGASTARDGILSKLIEVNSRIMLVGFVLWPPRERRL